jgi:glycosyltransferase involved in cell wall biosynthesis
MLGEYVAPHLDDNLRYAGEAGHAEKCALFGNAHALVAPIEWEEPFGLATIEALVSGTPVVAMRRGSTALNANGLAKMIALVGRGTELDPARLRQEAETRFSTAQMIDGYSGAYETMTVREPEPIFSAAA